MINKQNSESHGITRRNVLSSVSKSGVALGVGSILSQQGVATANDRSDHIAAYFAPDLPMDFSGSAVTVVSALSSADVLLVSSDGRIDRDLVVEALQSQKAVAAVGARAQHHLLASIYDVPPGRLMTILREGTSLPPDLDSHIATAADPSQQNRFTVLLSRGDYINTHTYNTRAEGSDVVVTRLQDTFDKYSSVGAESTPVPGGCGDFGHFEDPWNCLGTVHQELGSCEDGPHGEVDVYTTAAYVDDDDSRFFGVQQQFDIRPGIGEFSECQSEWRNDLLEVSNGYFNVDGGDGYLHDVQPTTTDGQTSEGTSLTAGLTADSENLISGSVQASWTKSYTLPGVVIQENEYNSQGIGGNDVEFGAETIQETTADFERSDLLAFPQTTNEISWSGDMRMTFRKETPFWNPDDEFKTYENIETLSFS